MKSYRSLTDPTLFNLARDQKAGSSKEDPKVRGDGQAIQELERRAYSAAQIERIRRGKKVIQAKSQLAERERRDKLHEKLDLVTGQLKLSDRVKQLLINPTKKDKRKSHKLPHLDYTGDIVQMSAGELERYAGFGRKALKEVREALAEHGLELGVKTDGWYKPIVIFRR